MKHDAHKRERTIKPMAAAPKPTLFSSAQEDALVEALFASIGDGAIATDEFGKVMRINAVALQILGYRKTEILGQWFPRLVVAFNDDNKQVEIIDRAITRAFLTGKAVSEKTNFLRKNGQKVPVSENVSTIILEGKPIGAIVIFRDITLEHEVDRMKSDFVSLASHQLRTPLSSINMYSQMLSAGYMGELTEQQRIPLQTIVESADRMSQLINTLLNVTRIENGTIVVHHKHIDMNALVEEVIRDLRPDATNKEIDLEFHAKNQQVLVNTDRLIMKEILSNLVSNAIKYTSKNGSVTVSLRLRNRQAMFSVADTGVGIPRYSQDKIFSKFFRAPNVMQRETTGTGLGLYLVKGMADQLGATVWFESELGKGSTFYLSLPAVAS
jgi:PAS domain S-box-containing protein